MEFLMQILGICGSLQARSNNLALLRVAAAAVPVGVELSIFDGVRELPLFNPDLEAAAVPESVTQWRNALATSDALLIACPEYGFSLPGALKNAIDWVIGSGELETKVVGITAAVPSRPRVAWPERAPRHAVGGACLDRWRRTFAKTCRSQDSCSATPIVSTSVSRLCCSTV
jgi:NAD(P)H-dependent FMN reductase